MNTSSIAFPAGLGACFPLIPGTKEPAIPAWRGVTPGAYSPVGSYGIALAASVLVIDADPRNYPPGRDVLAELITAYPAILNTFIVKTPRGGVHIYLSKPEGLKIKKHQSAWPGIDWLSDGAYVCGPGHETRAGKNTVDGVYEVWRQAPVGAAPDGLLSSLEPPADPDAASLEDATCLYAGQFQTICELEPASRKGSRGIDAYKQACKGRDLGLPLDETYRIMRDYYNPRSQPPLTDRELLTQVEHAYTYAKNGLGSSTPEANFKDFTPPPPPENLDQVAMTDEWSLKSAQAKQAAVSLNQIQPSSKNPSKRDQLVNCASKAEELFFSGHNKTAFAAVHVKGHVEHLKIKSCEFKAWLTDIFMTAHHRTPDSKSLQEAIEACASVAVSRGPELETPIRLAEFNGINYLDLCDDKRTVIAFSSDGWHLAENPPIRFYRPAGVTALPTPVRDSGASINRLRRLLNVRDDGVWSLLLSFLVCCLRPGYPKPFVLLTGEQGSGKTNLAKALRLLVDPHITPLDGAPQDEHQSFIATQGSHVLGFDNVSSISRMTADTLCRISSGGGIQKRKLFSDADTVHIHTSPRPMIMTSIVDPVSEHSDLRNRAILIDLATLPDDSRMTEEAFWKEFEEIKAGVLGFLLDALCSGLNELPKVSLPTSPRLIDFLRLGTACEKALGLAAGAVMRAYQLNESAARESVLDSSPIGNFMRDLTPIPWTGRMTELHCQARALLANTRNVPTSVQAMTNELKRITPALRAEGIHIERHKRKDKGVWFTISRTPAQE